jgi:hypothetical protein
MDLGVKAGMVRSVYNCKSGLDAFKEMYEKIAKENKPEDILKEGFLAHFSKDLFTRSLSNEDRLQWMKMKGKEVSASIDEALVEGQAL